MMTVGLYGIADTTHGCYPTYTHDHSIAIMRDGQVVTVVQLERWTGRKHDNRLGQFMTTILGELVPPDEEVRFVSVNSFVGSSFISQDGNLRIEPRREVEISAELVPAEVIWYPDGLHRKPAEGWVLSHEAAHLASILPFIGKFKEGALAAHIDGGASRSACSFWRIVKGRPVLQEASWDLLKDVVNNFNVNPGVRAILGLAPEQHLSIPGKLMGYAALGQARPAIADWLRQQHWLLDLDDKAAAAAIQAKFQSVDCRASTSMDICATIQQAFAQAVLQELSKRASAGGCLYYTGGAALNIPTNRLLYNHFDEVWIPPATNDSGLALGAAAWVEYCDHGRLGIHDPFLNRFATPAAEPPASVIAEVADCLLAGQVIGICNGAAEVGPRALGHRSLLARADDVSIRRRVSESIKKREWYRPLAPILCEAAAREVLEPLALSSPLTRWMLGAWQVRPAWQGALQGVLHADGSVRAQVVFNDGTNTWMHALLDLLWRRHGIPALINTSFNGPGQPIVQREDEALAAFRSLQLDGLVLHGSLHRH